MSRSALGGFTFASPATPAAPVFFDGVASRINMLASASDYSTASWSAGNLTVGTGIVAPDGTTTAQKLQETSANDQHSIQQTVTRLAVTALPFRYSVFAKAAERTRAFIVVYDSGFSNSANCLVDLANGTIVSSAVVGNYTNASAAIKAFSNGWYRINLDFTCNTNAQMKVDINTDGGSGNAALVQFYQGVTGSGILVWTSNLLPPAAWGMNRTFFDDFNSLSTIDVNNTKVPGFKWYTNNTFPNSSSAWSSATPTPSSGISISSSILTLSDGVSGFGENLNTVVDDGAGGFIGTTFTTPFMMEASVAFDTTKALGFHSPTSVPAFWTIATDELTQNFPASSVEFDVFEATGTGSGTAFVNTAMHQWLTNSDAFIDNAAYLGSPSFLAQHTYAYLILSKASNGGSFGYVISFFDGVYTGTDLSYAPGVASSPVIDGTGAISGADTRLFPIILGSGPVSTGYSSFWDFVAVYQ